MIEFKPTVHRVLYLYRVKWLRRILKFFAWFLGFLILVLLVLAIYMYSVADIAPPRVQDVPALRWIVQAEGTTRRIQNNLLQKNKFGLYEMYLEGDAYTRGLVYGKLASNLIRQQELAFTNEIQRMIPSQRYLKFLKYLVGFMNRNLSDYVIQEYQEEIYGISQAASQEFNWIGTNYSRQLNYHAAHDIGHALANMMLVGCTSFAAWDDASEDRGLIVGRNFDFYVGDEFAKDKIIAFYRPESGYPFASVTWGGFTGVVSGMNNQGLSVTINAAKSSIPFGAATPVSLVAREILQYASNIQEAFAIASKRKMFVSESFLIASAKDHKAVVLEKTPDELALFESTTNRIQCANHYQSNKLGPSELNQQQMQSSASVYRYKRLTELLDQSGPLSPQKTAKILRDYRGLGGSDIGLTNEKALNQFIAHHAVIFEPEKGRMWVSTAPWQLGRMICYDLNRIFSSYGSEALHADSLNDIAADSIIETSTFQQIQTYLRLEQAHIRHQKVDIPKLIASNPTYYDTWRIAGDQYRMQGQKDSALKMYKQALLFEIATEDERMQLRQKIESLTNARQ